MIFSYWTDNDSKTKNLITKKDKEQKVSILEENAEKMSWQESGNGFSATAKTKDGGVETYRLSKIETGDIILSIATTVGKIAFLTFSNANTENNVLYARVEKVLEKIKLKILDPT